ncbi:MAG: hypothetical protein AAF184_18420 [Pseudomonadota bacterium]
MPAGHSHAPTIAAALACLGLLVSATGAATDGSRVAVASGSLGTSRALLRQSPNGGCVDVSNHHRQQYAEDFVLPRGEDQRLDRLVVTGVYEFNNLPPTHDAYTLQVMGQWFGSELPDTRHPPLCTFDDQRPFFRVPTGRIVNGLEVYELTYYFDEACVLPANQTYWLEVVDANGQRGDSFAWECADPDQERGLAGSAVANATSPIKGREWIASSAGFSIALDATDASDPTPITSRVRGIAGARARCINATREQVLDIPLGADRKTMWNCTAAGLEAAAGDVIVQFMFGVVTAPDDIAGATTGELGETVQCINQTSGQISAVPPSDDAAWSCTGSGFLAQAGDDMVYMRVGVAE